MAEMYVGGEVDKITVEKFAEFIIGFKKVAAKRNFGDLRPINSKSHGVLENGIVKKAV